MKGRANFLRFPVTRQVGYELTNIGNCIPNKVTYDLSLVDDLDKKFAEMTELPERLEETDMISIDSAELARMGVVGYAPTYTLFSDNAKKLRYLRLPKGTSLAFDRSKQTFRVPPNTRIYKTFLKEVIDERGQKRYRKMETRLIVSRPDRMLTDGTVEPAALFGTYAWNESETQAVLVRDPLRNGKPFRDRLVTYITDELRAKPIIDSDPPDVIQALAAQKLTRTYAIPGSTRCVQCHMGSPNGSFLLGLEPIQLRRHALGEHGVIEAAGPDERTQLRRFIDYGVVTGMGSPSEVAVLEESQGARKPRNYYEVVAQGYMVGNCGFCHNPRGYPSITVPSIAPLLDFWPRTTGGIFQFPLDRFSPRIKRGAPARRAHPVHHAVD